MRKKLLTIVGILLSSFMQLEASSSVEVDILWVGIVGLIITLILIATLIISSKQVTNLKKLHKNILGKQAEMEKSQNLLLTNMSENIHSIATEALEKSSLYTEKSEKKFEDKATLLDNTEHKLLGVTTDLIDFLRLKSKKIGIVDEEFNINNVLNEISGAICSKYIGTNIEFVFDIDTNVPRTLIGDSLHLGQILNNILEYLLEHYHLEEIRVEISVFETSNKSVELQFRLVNMAKGLEAKTLESIFLPYYHEGKGAYVGLGLYVAKELVGMMKGELTVESNIKRGTTFTIGLPFKLVNSFESKGYILPPSLFAPKKVFIVDNSYNSALAIKKMFSYFKYDVKVVTKEEFISSIPNLKEYDIVVLNEGLFSVRLIEYIRKLQTNREIKVISLDSLLNSSQNNFVNPIIDLHLFKPLNQERIFEMLLGLYDVGGENELTKGNKDVDAKVVQTHSNYIVESKGINQKSFKDFAGKNILIVEDNLINQKVLINLFHVSEINITLANNGQEAVDIVKEGTIHYDLVLMDINMPIMDGYAATQMIRLDNQFDYLPIVAFTALVLDSEIKKMFNIGINAFLSKPLNIGRLYTAMAMYLLEKPKVTQRQEEKLSKKIFNYEGLNVKKGIEHANNSEALYIEVLKEFVEAYGESAEVFKKLILEHRYEQVKILCLDMRGLTGTIGANEIHALINEILHTLLYKNFEVLPKYTEKYVFELDILLKSIEKYTSYDLI